jgi:hypothetical protein
MAEPTVPRNGVEVVTASSGTVKVEHDGNSYFFGVNATARGVEAHGPMGRTDGVTIEYVPTKPASIERRMADAALRAYNTWLAKQRG